MRQQTEILLDKRAAGEELTAREERLLYYGYYANSCTMNGSIMKLSLEAMEAIARPRFDCFGPNVYCDEGQLLGWLCARCMRVSPTGEACVCEVY